MDLELEIEPGSRSLRCFSQRFSSILNLKVLNPSEIFSQKSYKMDLELEILDGPRSLELFGKGKKKNLS